MLSDPERSHQLHLAVSTAEEIRRSIEESKKTELARLGTEIRSRVLSFLNHYQTHLPDILPRRLLARTEYHGVESDHAWRDVDYLVAENRFEHMLRVGPSRQSLAVEVSHGGYDAHDADWLEFGPTILRSFQNSLESPR